MKSKITRHRSQDVWGGLLESLWAFHQRFVVRTRDSFVDGIRAADEVWTLETDAGLGGFATVKRLRVDTAGRARMVLYTQWAFIEPALRRQGFIHRVALSAWTRCKLRHPLRPIYWVFSASSVDAYMHMMRSMPVAYPRMNAAMPVVERKVLNETMGKMSPSQWDLQSGTLQRKGEVRYIEGQSHNDDSHPDVVFYRSLNPHQWRGDSLGCIAPATARAAVAYVARIWRRKPPAE